MQLITSANTARNQIPALHKKLVNHLKGDVLDYGAGKYDTAKTWMESENNNIKLFTYDPFNLSPVHNYSAMNRLYSNIICTNVLNVIQYKKDRIAVYKHLLNLKNANFSIYFAVYNATKTSKYDETELYVGQETIYGWQNCQPLSFYLKEITDFMSKNNSIKVYKDYILVTNK